MNKILHNIWISLIITSLLCLACDKEDPIKTEDSPVVNNDTLKVEVITSDAIGIQPKSATLAALCSVSGADNLQAVSYVRKNAIAYKAFRQHNSKQQLFLCYHQRSKTRNTVFFCSKYNHWRKRILRFCKNIHHNAHRHKTSYSLSA